MITLRTRYFYANMSKPTYQVETIDGVLHYLIGIVEADNVSEAIALGYTIGGFTVVSRNEFVSIVPVTVNDIPKLKVYIPVVCGEGMDGFATIQFVFSKNGTQSVLTESISTFPMYNFHVSCQEQPNGIDVWAMDITGDCETEAINDDCIDVSITDIIFTAQGERPRRTTYGSPIPRVLWNNLDNAMAETILDKTIEAIARFERRVAVDRRRASMTIDRRSHTVLLTIPCVVLDQQKKYLYRKKFATQ